MWVHTAEGELVNLDHVEFIRVEENEEDQSFEVRAYPISVGEPEEDLYYLLSWSDDEASARSAFDSMVASMTRGSAVVDLRTSLPG